MGNIRCFWVGEQLLSPDPDNRLPIPIEVVNLNKPDFIRKQIIFTFDSIRNRLNAINFEHTENRLKCCVYIIRAIPGINDYKNLMVIKQKSIKRIAANSRLQVNFDGKLLDTDT